MGKLLAIPAVMVVLLAGALVWSGGAAHPRADFAFINRGDIYTLDLNRMSFMQDFRLTYGIREGLFSPDPETLRPVPTGAASYDISPDKKVWTFRLRPEAKWSNGDPVTAADYVFSWRRMLEQPGEYTYLFYYVTNAERYEAAYAKRAPFDFGTVGMKAVDPLRLRVELDDPVPYLPDLLAFPPFYPRHERSMAPFLLTQADGKTIYDAAYTRPPHVVTNGPFVLTKWEYKVRLLLEKSPTYWDKANVRSDRLEMVVNENALSQFLQYDSGQVDWLADVKGDEAAELRAKGRTDLHSSPAFGTAFLTFLVQPTLPPGGGGGKNPLADARVRQALAMTIDKKFITDNITRMGELPARTYLPPDGTLPDFRWLPGPHQPAGGPTAPYAPEEVRALLPDAAGPAGPGLPYDVKRARALMADAGYPNGQGLPVLPILFNSENPTRAKIAQALKDQWRAALGVTIEVQQIEGKVYKERLSKKDYAIGLGAWYGDYPDASTFTDKYLSTSLQNDCDWRSKAYDDLCAAAKKEPDAAARVTLLSRAEHLIDTEVPIVPLYHYTNVSMSRSNVEGVLPNPRGTTIFKAVKVRR
ncbi:MAG: ABC-type oligopeptide transport system, periplasmic component [Phycisphaerales bacterium]|nr:ABC-type oligopeptide transport system, periplasmic component [Phycisphaerales bacterium]